VHLEKRSGNSLSPRLCTNVKKYCRRNLTQLLFSCWSSPVVSRVWVETQTKVKKGQKMGRAEASLTGAAYVQRYVYFSVSVCSIGTWGKGRWLTLKMNLATCCQKLSIQSLVFHTFPEVWVARSWNSDMGGSQISLGSADLAASGLSLLMPSQAVEVFWCYRKRLKSF